MHNNYLVKVYHANQPSENCIFGYLRMHLFLILIYVYFSLFIRAFIIRDGNYFKTHCSYVMKYTIKHIQSNLRKSNISL